MPHAQLLTQVWEIYKLLWPGEILLAVLSLTFSPLVLCVMWWAQWPQRRHPLSKDNRPIFLNSFVLSDWFYLFLAFRLRPERRPWTPLVSLCRLRQILDNITGCLSVKQQLCNALWNSTRQSTLNIVKLSQTWDLCARPSFPLCVLAHWG